MDGWVLLAIALLAFLLWAVAKQCAIERRRAEYDARREGRAETEAVQDAVRETWWREDVDYQLTLHDLP